MVGPGGNGTAVAVEGVVGAAQLSQGYAEVVEGVGVLGPGAEGGLVVGYGVGEPAVVVVQPGQSPGCLGVGRGGA